MQRQNLEERAERTLRDTDAYQVPVPIHLVAQRLNLTLEAATLGEKVSGLLVVQGDRARIGRRKTVGHGGDTVRDTGVPDEPALAVLDEIAIVDEVHRLAFVDAGRPTRDVAGDPLAAIEDVEFFHPGLRCAFVEHPRDLHQRRVPDELINVVL